MKKEIRQNPQEISTDQERRQLFLRYINRGWLGFGVVTLVTLPFFPDQRTVFTYLIAVVFPTYLAVRFLNLSGRTRAAGVVFTLAVNFVFYGLFLLLVRDMGAEEAFRSQMTVWMLMGLAVLFAGALIDRRAAFVIAFINSILLIGTRLTLAPQADARPSAMVFWWMIAIVIWLYEGTLQRALRQAWDELAERKRGEEALQLSEQRFSKAFHKSPLPMTISTLEDGRYVEANANYLNMVGYSREDLIGRTALEMGLWADPGERGRIVELLKRNQSLNNEEIHYVTARGEERLAVASYDVIELDGAPHLLGLFNDITERKRVEEALLESEQTTRLIIDTALDAVITIDQKGLVTNWNDQAEAIFGWKRLDAIGQPVASLIVPEDQRSAHDNGMKRYFETGEGAILNHRTEMMGRRKDGSLFPVELTVRVMQGRASFAGFVRDITDRKQSEERIKRQVQRLEALHRIDMVITSGLDMKISLNLMLDQILSFLNVDAAAILLMEPHTRLLYYADSRGFRSDAVRHAEVQIGQSHAGQAVFERRLVYVPDLTAVSDDSSRAIQLVKENFISYHAIPLIAKGQVKGVMELFHRSQFQPDEEWLNFARTMASQAAIIIEDTQLFNDLQRSNFELSAAYDATIEGWSKALDLRDKETEGHTQRVTELTLKLAERMGINQQELIHMRRGALLHDIGKMGVPDYILHKPGALTEEEWSIMRQHPTHAHNMLLPIAYLRPALDIPHCHHEKWDGSGYPRGLKGEQIPLAARLFAVVDVWDALRSDRPYRPGWSAEQTRQYILEQSGKYFDPAIVQIFQSLIENA